MLTLFNWNKVKGLNRTRTGHDGKIAHDQKNRAPTLRRRGHGDDNRGVSYLDDV